MVISEGHFILKLSLRVLHQSWCVFQCVESNCGIIWEIICCKQMQTNYYSIEENVQRPYGRHKLNDVYVQYSCAFWCVYTCLKKAVESTLWPSMADNLCFLFSEGGRSNKTSPLRAVFRSQNIYHVVTDCSFVGNFVLEEYSEVMAKIINEMKSIFILCYNMTCVDTSSIQTACYADQLADSSLVPSHLDSKPLIKYTTHYMVV